MTAVIRTVADLRATVAAWRRNGETIGLVPTMGALHDGHLSLAAHSRADNKRSIATLFVNPTQFGPKEDLAAYPRDEAADLAKLQSANVDALYAPSVAEMYPKGFATTVTVAGLTDHLCGPHRPGHFAGVATVVSKLLLQATPDRAYFGEKDFQQLQVIRRMAADLDIPVRIVGVPTVREADRLALSSRNRYLSAEDRAHAAALPRMLADIAGRLSREPGAVAREIAWGFRQLEDAGFRKVDYIEVCDVATLQPTRQVTAPSRVFAAAWLGRTRLIDNWQIGAA
ncbi:MAG TPA: pantoate--beta-alanine ligase [Verrucomicrobiae bacterium]|nr:pantoate--beta-alanine ligase [Verrucomicrobiae bacterium]